MAISIHHVDEKTGEITASPVIPFFVKRMVTIGFNLSAQITEQFTAQSMFCVRASDDYPEESSFALTPKTRTTLFDQCFTLP
jgi:hypothetical protein